MKPKAEPPAGSGAVSTALCCSLLAVVAFFSAGCQAGPITDKTEVDAVNSIFRQWNISASMSQIKWNTSDDICDGSPVSDWRKFDDDLYNPNIICDCSYENGTVCHITRLKAYNLNIVGRIPDELQYLLYLENLQIGRNYLTGLLPAYIGNFTAMKYLSCGFNSLSGNFPKELGKLANLVSLGVDVNNFSGPVPPELGSLMNLEQMYLDSAGFSGELPAAFANLQRLKIMYAADNNFSGKLPESIGSMPSLQRLRLHGNSFQGPIPGTFANLTGLQELWLSDLSSATSSLAFISNMTSLNSLVLRNCKISENIPTNFEKYTGLTYLDLSFNNLTGQILDSLFKSDSLQSLYLGNNSLSGKLPATKSDQLVDIDLSYNDLSGTFPSWSSQDNVKLNLVANDLVADKSNKELPGKLSCLQNSFPCYFGSPVYYSLAINCGGNKSVESNGTIYEADDQDLSTASYYVKDNYRWAVSSIGTFLGASHPEYVEYTSANFSHTSNPELFQSMRLSPSSLRYYGLALENGFYTVTLEFAETAFPDNFTWKSFGKRVFDIYIQGNLTAKDFDIRKEAGGRSFNQVTKQYTALVSENILEIHFLWAGKGTSQIPRSGYYGPSISAISVTPNFIPTVSNQLPTSSKRIKAIIGGVVSGIMVLLFLLVLGIFIRWKRRHARMTDDAELQGLAIIPNTFSLDELKAATEDFSPSNKLGQGGFGSVFKGKLADGRNIAVKKLSVVSLQGKRQFVAEVATISAVQHQNLVRLYGCCYEGDNRLLVYELLENGSLDHALFGKSCLQLDWTARFNICLGTARGLAYLHEESRLRIVHRDVKASNILLDADLTPKISDFGLAKLYDDKLTHISTRVAGTVGYLAPEYALRGHLTEKADVYGFGVLVLEILSGRPNIGSVSTLDGEKLYLLDWAWLLHEHNCDINILDPKLTSVNEKEALRMVGVAFMCTQTNPMSRPSMSRVVAMLVGDVEITKVSSKPVYLTEWMYEDANSSFLTGTMTASTSASTVGNPPTTSIGSTLLGNFR